jgi:hypothetical protein
MKIVGILQPGYLPWLGFFEQMLRSDIFVIYDDVQYDKHGWRNRNRVKGPDGPVWLTVPVRIKGLNKPAINEVAIDPAQPRWAKKHCQTLRQLYGKAPFLGEYLPRLEETLLKPWEKILDLDLALIRLIADWLGLNSELVLSSTLSCRAEDPTVRLVEICRAVGADIFYEGSSGKNYLDLPRFAAAGIQVVFQEYECQPYPQLYGGFISHLSIVDLLFNCGPESPGYLPGLRPPPHFLSSHLSNPDEPTKGKS